MEWYEKEAAYDAVYASGRQAKNLWRYIPDKLAEAVVEADSDIDGYWVYLDHEAGWVAYDGGEDCGIIHEYNIADLKSAIKTIRRITDGQ